MSGNDELDSGAPATAPLYSSSSAVSPKPSKLVVISTGLWGAKWNVEFMRERLQEAGGADVLVYSAVCNVMLNSYSGVDVCGKRLAAEVRSLFSERSDLDQVRSVSFIGYSAGGLYVRYAVGVLHDEGFFSEKGITLDKVMSAATPHLGVRSSPRARMGRCKNGLLDLLGNAYGGRSLEQMCLADSHAPDGNPLLLHMSLPGTRYTDALKASGGVFFYANALNDNTVSYCTAAVAKTNQYRHLTDIPRLEGFPVIAGVFPISDGQDLHRNGESDISGYKPAPSRTVGTDPEPAGERPATGSESTAVPAVRGKGPMPSSGVGTAAVAMIFAPILVAQFVLLIFPLRVAHSICTDDEFKSSKTAKSVDSKNKNASMAKEETRSPDGKPLPEGHPEQAPSKTDSTGGEPAPVTMPSVAEPLLEFSPEETSAPRSYPEGATTAASAGANASANAKTQPAEKVQGSVGTIDPSGEVCSSEAEMKEKVLKGGADGVPGTVRRNLARPELGIKRVDVCLPGLHTHGSIVVRRSYVSQEGRIVIDHMASLLFG